MKYLLIGCVCLVAQFSMAQPWVRVNAVPALPFIALEKDNNVLYAATNGNAVYISPDNGINWSASNLGAPPINITSITVFHHKLYVGTNLNGVFMSSDTGRTWAHTGIGLLSVNSFTEWRNNLYAATLGTGLFQLNEANNSWGGFSNDLPSYSVNVFAVANVNDSLIAAAGANGTFYYYNPASAKWEEKYYFSILRPGVLVSEMIVNESSVLGVKDGQAIIRSDNNRNAWQFDTTGLMKLFGSDVRIGSGTDNFYAAVNDRAQGGSWIQKHSKVSGITQTWTMEGDFLPAGYTSVVKEIDSRLFLCRTDGLYFKELVTTGVNDPVPDQETLSVYPNPSGGRNITIRSNQVINEVTIVNMAGTRVFRATMKQTEFHLPVLANGFYIAQIRMNKKLVSRKIVVE